MKYLSERAIDYMDRVWGFSHSDGCYDTDMFWSANAPEMVAKRFVDGGAVEPNCKEAKEMIEVADSITSKEEDEIIDACLKNHTILECVNCGHVHFINNEWADPSDWHDSCEGCGQSTITKAV